MDRELELSMLRPAVHSELAVVDHSHPSWDAFVAAHAHGTIFHMSAMINAMAATPGLEPLALAAVNASGEILAMLVSVHVKTLKTMQSFSSRAIQFATPLCVCESEGTAALDELIRLHDSQMRSRSLFVEVRCIHPPAFERAPLLASGYTHCDYINYEVDLSRSKEELWKNIDKGMRQKINSSRRKGVEVVDDESSAGIARMYTLLKESYGRARVPLAPFELFEAVLNGLPPESVRIRTAVFKNNPVASIISLIHAGRVFSWYGGTRRIKGLSPFACIVWDDIRWGCENGMSIYDFGGAGWPGEDYGPRRFKASFGGAEVRYGRYRATYSPIRLRLAELAYRASQSVGVWSGSKKRRVLRK